MSRRLPALLILLGTSCGYEIGNLYDVRDVKVDIFDNTSERRTQEFDLTDSIVREITARGIRVIARDAAYTLKGRILDMRTPPMVEQKGTDQVILTSLQIALEIRLIDSNANEVWKDTRVETASYSVQRGETFDTARRKVFDRLARWVVSHLEKQW